MTIISFPIQHRSHVIHSCCPSHVVSIPVSTISDITLSNSSAMELPPPPPPLVLGSGVISPIILHPLSHWGVDL